MPNQQVTKSGVNKEKAKPTISESGDCWGSEARLSPKWPRPLRVLHDSFQGSLLQLLVAECYNFFLRISVLVRTLKQVLPEPCQRCFRNYKVLLACSEDMTRLQREHRWLGLLECRVAAQAWAMGAKNHCCSFGNEESNGKPIRPS
jgi:hypothetical protein